MPRDKEKQKEYSRQYHQKNKEKRNKQNKEYYANNRERLLTIQRDYYENNKEAKREYSREYNARYRKSPEGERIRKQYYVDNKETIIRVGRKNWLKRTYNLTEEQYDKLLEFQDNVCAICKHPETVISKRTGEPYALAVDHDKETGEVRGLLCSDCNTTLGRIGDTEDSIRVWNNNALAYFEDISKRRETIT